VSVEVLAGSVVVHGGARVGVPGGNLQVAQVHAGVEHGGDEGVPEPVGMHPRQPHPGRVGQASQSAGGGVPVLSGSSRVQQDQWS